MTVAFCAIFFLTFLKQGLPARPSYRHSGSGQLIIVPKLSRQLDATQLGKVLKYDSFAEAREDMQSGKITAVCVIPAGMYADVQASRRPTFTYYLNGLYFVGGALSYKNILTMINLADGAVQREVLRAKGVNEDAIMGRIRPVNVECPPDRKPIHELRLLPDEHLPSGSPGIDSRNHIDLLPRCRP